MDSKEPQKYILIEPTTLEDIQAWATDEVVESPIFKPFDEDAIRKKVTEMINTAYKIGYIHDTSYLSDLTVDDALEICVDAILRITTGETLGRKQ